MTRKIRQTIEELANLVREYCNTKVSPIPEKEIVSALGGTLSYVDCQSIEGKGIVKKRTDDTAQFEIQLANTLSLSEGRFVLFHELGHLFLHMGFMIDDELWLRSTCCHKAGYSEEEIEADEFALDIMMPAQQYRKVLLENCSGESIDMTTIAAYFNVPLDAAISRGRRLGCLEW